MCRLSKPETSSPATPVKQWCFTRLLSGMFTTRDVKKVTSQALALDGTCFCVGKCCCVSKSKPNLLTTMPTTESCSISIASGSTVASENSIAGSCSPCASPESPSTPQEGPLRRRSSHLSLQVATSPTPELFSKGPQEESVKVATSPNPESPSTESKQHSMIQKTSVQSDRISQRQSEAYHDINSLGLVHLLTPAGGCLYFMRLILAYT